MITRILCTALFAAALAVAPLSAAESDAQHPTAKVMHTQTKCPLTGDNIDKDIFSDYKGKRVYFCCADCKTTFEKDPDMVMNKIMIQHIQLEKSPSPQTACPISGEDIDKSMYSDVDGQRVYFCCQKCKTAFDSSEETRAKALKKMADEGVALEKVAQQQSMCPVMGGEVNTALYSDADGKRVYFCCAMCKPEFEKDPARYIHEMEARGITLAAAPKGE